MKQAMKQWLHRHQMDFNIDTIHSLCDKLGLDEEKKDGCYMLAADLEQGRINEPEFTAGLSVLTGKEPEEVVEMVKGMKTHVTSEITKLISTKDTNVFEIQEAGVKVGDAIRDIVRTQTGEVSIWRFVPTKETLAKKIGGFSGAKTAQEVLSIYNYKVVEASKALSIPKAGIQEAENAKKD